MHMCAAVLEMAVILCRRYVTCLLSSAVSQTMKKHANKLVGRLANPFELLTVVASDNSVVSRRESVGGLLMPAATCTESDGHEQGRIDGSFLSSCDHWRVASARRFCHLQFRLSSLICVEQSLKLFAQSTHPEEAPSHSLLPRNAKAPV